MAFGVKREELTKWKRDVLSGEIAFLTHFWYDSRFPQYKTVTKAGCADIKKLINWGKKYGFKEEWIHNRDGYPHFDLLGENQLEILQKEGITDQIIRFKLEERLIEVLKGK
ncbi:hypothetical protein CIB95_12410 [Lottiidibacillus patelloidae]|uniref:YneQ n=1 Tax=Lottiidibacillus patelloidae TaxID=2670334 RepID=A0A263BR87_9BACI|nr:hypothetical protein [Lottiidibacillus patelloidae]OZM56221.1 hypothetical protein CIB95_12410 [Lottiidibacillus patelloidae]